LVPIFFKLFCWAQVIGTLWVKIHLIIWFHTGGFGLFHTVFSSSFFKIYLLLFFLFTMGARYLDFIIVFPHWRHRIGVFFEVFLHWFLSRRFLWKAFSLRFQGIMVTSLEKGWAQILVFFKEVFFKKWKLAKVSSWFSPWISQGITKGDTYFETHLWVLNELRIVHMKPFKNLIPYQGMKEWQGQGFN
jgi:hypothetical protein